MDIYKKNYFCLNQSNAKKIIYGFFSREGGQSKDNYKFLNCSLSSFDKKNDVMKNIDIAKKNLDIKNHKLKFIKQIHSSKVIIINKNNFNIKNEADGMITKNKKIALSILTADCAPIFIYDNKNPLICALHSGWKGCLNDIITNSIKQITSINHNINNLSAIVGPCLAKRNFEVSSNFQKNFLIKCKKYERFFSKKKESRKYLFDMRGLINFQLKQNLIKNISNIDIDTYDKKNLFFSHRRSFHQNKLPTGRMINIIAFNEKA